MRLLSVKNSTFVVRRLLSLFGPRYIFLSKGFATAQMISKPFPVVMHSSEIFLGRSADPNEIFPSLL